jgi:hypothetical protein
VAKTPVKGWSRNVQPSPWWTGWRLTVVLLLIVVAGGTIGYVLIEDWPVWDAL